MDRWCELRRRTARSKHSPRSNARQNPHRRWFTRSDARRRNADRAQADTAIRRVRQYDPYWKPTPSLFETPEGEIAANRATAKEAADHYRWLQYTALAPGLFARESIPLGAGRNFTRTQRRLNTRYGRRYGCHTCGRKDPGTKTGNFYLDHQPPLAMRRSGPWRGFPHCKWCSNDQAVYVKQYLIYLGILK